MLGLVGPNGAGKTTTIRSVAGILRPTAGRVAIGGHDMATDPVAAKSLLALVPDEPHLFEYLTVEEHLRFVGRLYQVPDAEAQIPALLEEVELDGQADGTAGGAFPGDEAETADRLRTAPPSTAPCSWTNRSPASIPWVSGA